jgi:ATP-dependent helicase HrpA
VTLYGVPIVARRRVQLGRVDPVTARDLFIRHALVDGEWDLERLSKAVTAFDRANRALRRELGELEERTRRRDILFDDEAVFEFYDKRIPADITDQRRFETWWKKTLTETPDLLTMTADALVDEPEAAVDENSFPSEWRQDDQRYALSYRFEPGAEDDGVTVKVPMALLASLKPEGFDWQVPGLREELVTALIKALPKAIRRNVVPAADWAKRLVAELPNDPGDESLTATLAAAIKRLTYVPVTAADFELERVPAHLLPTFAAIDERGRVAGADKDLLALQARLKTTVRESVAKVSATPKNDLERSGLTGWDFDALPATLDTRVGGNTVRAYPALVDRGGSVDIRLMSTPEDQGREHRAGVRRLLLLATPSPVSYLQEHLSQKEKLALASSPYRNTAELFADCLAACVDAVLGEREVRTQAQFEAARDEISAGIVDALFQSVALVAGILTRAREVEKAISSASSMALLSPLADAREQLATLVYPGFVSATGIARLRRLPVYLDGLLHRIGRLAENLARDRAWMAEVQTATDRYRLAGGTLPLMPDAAERLRHARWLLEELRLSLFAQHLPTAEPVSLQRIGKVLAG